MPSGQQRLVFPLVESEDLTFSYRATAASTDGVYDFTGTVTDRGQDVRQITGETQVTVQTGATVSPPAQETDDPTPPSDGGPGASRLITPNAVDGGGRVVVTINATDYGTFGVVTETLPDGFDYVANTVTPSEISVEITGQTAKFVLFGETSFSYTVTASGTAGQHTFSGTLTDDDNAVYDVGGDIHVAVNAIAGPRASRVLSSSSVNAGRVFSVSVSAADYGTFGVVAETLPSGFVYVADSVRPSDIAVELVDQTASFVLFGETSFSYSATASSAVGNYEFVGNLTDDDNNEYPVGGDFQITVRTAPPPSTGGGGERAPEPTRNRAPAFVEGGDASRSVAENSAGGTAVGEPISANDRDNDKLAYQFRSEVDEFEIDKATGQITVSQDANLDYESKRSYSVTVRVSDPDDRTDDISVTINITDVDEEGIVEVSAETPELGSELTAAVMDPDGDVTSISWQWERSEDQMTWTSIEGATAATYTPETADEGQYLRATVAYTDKNGADKMAAMAFASPVPVVVVPTPEPTPVPTPAPTPAPTGADTAPDAGHRYHPRRHRYHPRRHRYRPRRHRYRPRRHRYRRHLCPPLPTATAVPATPTPAPTARPAATPVPTVSVAPAPTPPPAATPEPTPIPVVEEEEEGGFPVWAIIVIVIVGVLAVGGGGFLVWRRMQQSP